MKYGISFGYSERTHLALCLLIYASYIIIGLYALVWGKTATDKYWCVFMLVGSAFVWRYVVRPVWRIVDAPKPSAPLASFR